MADTQGKVLERLDWNWIVEQHSLTPTSINIQSIYVQEYGEFLAANLWLDCAHGPVDPDKRQSWWLELTEFCLPTGDS
ncbi:MAG TPA: hypothetical protein DD856_11645 [Sulfobacillus sp.]|nr:hypothetical protein [Sulfobacillus sp.]